ncbi:chemotaxis protein CheA [Rheinheimera texasensis]|uniref:chemotaxis protein CheA n=1 Tax=Rheinheimera texasensis TaxID=306205 RepID=UPI0004E0B945|nr:chemotaxis protein CheA [Rheinheimera texasensis]
MDLTQARSLFIEEALGLLEVMEACLLEIEAGDATAGQHIDAIFRAAHTIKGSAGLFGFDAIVAFTHIVESVLDKVRDQKISLDHDLCDLCLLCQDHLMTMIRQLQDDSIQLDLHAGEQLLARLHLYLDGKPALAMPEAETAAMSEHWQFDVRYGADVFRDGMDPMSQLSYLATLGTLTDVHLSAEFPAEHFDPESCYLRLHANLASEASKQTLEDVFEFVRDSSEIHITVPKSISEQLAQQDISDEKLGTLLVQAGAVTPRELQQALQAHKQQEIAIGQALVQQGAVPPELISTALDKQKATEHKRPADFQFLKVEARKLDGLINLIGELVTSGAEMDSLLSELGNSKITESFSVLNSLLEQIRDGALSLRMVQIGESFSRLRRIVRDVSKELGKEIDLIVEGADTELDKSMVEKLSDPLMHIVRNALDHGIEPTELRLYKGKPAQGQLKLSARHEAGSVVIEISDDGAGLNVQKIRDKAIEKGILAPDRDLSEADTYKLIFEPGFSTAAAVTNLSGRGVGMDVVRRNIEELRGQIQIRSAIEKGTTFSIRLPLTLAIIDGFLVSVADTKLVLPLNMVQECMEFKPGLQTQGRNYLDLRGEVLPFIRLSDIFRLPGRRLQRENVVIVQYGSDRAGLVVDALHGELQAVIKPLNSMFQSLRGIGGSTILGSGDIGLILDIPQLVQFATNLEMQTCHP